MGVKELIFMIKWSLYFMQNQGPETKHMHLYQDNKSTILLETKEKISHSKQTKHIKAKIFLITYKVEHGEVVVEHLPTDGT